jgi:hypothetical protein
MIKKNSHNNNNNIRYKIYFFDLEIFRKKLTIIFFGYQDHHLHAIRFSFELIFRTEK